MRKQAVALVAMVPVLAIAAGAGMVQPERDGGNRPQRQPGGDPGAFVDRILENDANGDGKISREEMGEGRAARIFDAADANKDDLLDRAELEAFMQQRFQNGPGQGRNPNAPDAQAPGGPGGAPAVAVPSAEMFHNGMEVSGRAMRRLNRSEFAEETRMGDLALIQTVQRGLMDAKMSYMQAEVSEEAVAKFAADPAQLRTELRMQLTRALQASLDFEMALLEGDTKSATEFMSKLKNIQGRGHDMFEPKED
jgi:hypothetical protein